MSRITHKNQKLMETTLSTLYNNTNRMDSPRQQNSGTVQIRNKVFVPAPSNGILEVRADTGSSAASQYQTLIAFDDIEYVDEETGETTRFTASDGQDYIIVPIGYNNNDVKVRCTCLDFFYHFAAWNASDGSLQGDAPEPYVKKTDREPINPTQTPGLCKHLIKLTDELRRERIIR